MIRTKLYMNKILKPIVESLPVEDYVEFKKEFIYRIFMDDIIITGFLNDTNTFANSSMHLDNWLRHQFKKLQTIIINNIYLVGGKHEVNY